AFTPLAPLELPPGKKSRPTMPLLAVQRKACPGRKGDTELVPTTTVPSAFTPLAELALPPGKKPRPVVVPLTQRKACPGRTGARNYPRPRPGARRSRHWQGCWEVPAKSRDGPCRSLPSNGRLGQSWEGEGGGES